VKSFLRFSAILLVLPLLASAASAQTYDLFHTDPSHHPSVNVGVITGLSPSTVSFEGRPVSDPNCSLGSTDTVVQRSDASGTLQPVVTVLLLKNVAGTNATYNGNPVDVYATVNNSNNVTNVPGPTGPSQAPGTMNIGSDHTFSATLHVTPQIVLVDSSNNVVLSQTDSSFNTDLSATGMTGPPSSTTPNCGDFPNGGIVVTTILHTAPTHVHQVLPACVPQPPAGTAASTGGGGVTPACPVPIGTTSTTASQSAAKQ